MKKNLSDFLSPYAVKVLFVVMFSLVMTDANCQWNWMFRTYDPEPNNSIADAREPVAQYINATIGSASDVDYWKFTVTDAKLYTFVIDRLPVNLDLYLLNSAGTTIASSMQAGNIEEDIDKHLQPGTYYLMVKGVNNAYSQSQYRLSYHNSVEEETTDLNGSLANATIIYGNHYTSRGITTNSDKDFYKFDITSAQYITLLLSHVHHNLDLNLYNSAGTVIATSANLGNANESILNKNLAAGTYYVSVHARGNTFDARDYQLRLLVSSNILSSCFTAHDNDQLYPTLDMNYNSANPFSLNSTVERAFNVQGDGDLYEIDVPQEGSLNISLKNLATSTVIWVYRATGVETKKFENNSTEDINFNIPVEKDKYLIQIASRLSPKCYKLTNSLTCNDNTKEALRFNGTNHSAEIPYSPSLNFGYYDFTMEAHVYIENSPVTMAVLSNRMASTIEGFILGIHSGHLFMQLAGQNYGYVYVGTNAFRHIAVSRRDDYLHLYVDGQLMQTVQVDFRNVSTTSPLRIGKDWLSSNFFKGYIGEIRIWNYARSSSEINSNYDRNISPQPGLVGLYDMAVRWYTMTDRFGSNMLLSELTDGSGKNNHGYLGDMQYIDNADPLEIGKCQLPAGSKNNFREAPISSEESVPDFDNVLASGTVSPNPFVDEARLSFKGTFEGEIKMEVYNYTGESVFKKEKINKNEIVQFGETLPSGVFLVILTYPKGNTETIKVVKQ